MIPAPCSDKLEMERAGRPEATGYYAAYYRTHWMGPNPAWGKWETDDDDGGVGNDRDQIDMIELTICPM